MDQTARQSINENNDLRAEYDAIRNGVAVMDLSESGLLRLTGKNAVQFLNGLVSNEVKSLAPGHGVAAAFPNLQGKLLALARIYKIGDGLLLELDAINREKIFNNLNRFVPAGEFFLSDLKGETSLLSLQGPRSSKLIESMTGKIVDSLSPYQHMETTIDETAVMIAAHSRCGEPGFDLFVPTAEAEPIMRAIIEGGRDFGTMRVGDAAFEIARIEAGIPREGRDAGENHIILESELNDAVSYTKGCYLGQEVIARIHWRGQPAKRLRGLLIESDTVPPPGTLLYAVDGKKIGEITSAAHSLALDRPIALGYVHRNYLDPGTRFVLKNEDEEIGHAELAELPFVGAGAES